MDARGLLLRKNIGKGFVLFSLFEFSKFKRVEFEKNMTSKNGVGGRRGNGVWLGGYEHVPGTGNKKK